MYVIRPFRAQGPTELDSALLILRIRPYLITAGLLTSLLTAKAAWPRTRARQIALGLSRINVFEIMFHPIDAPTFQPAAQTTLEANDKRLAIAGPLKDRALQLVHSDEFTFARWRAEQPTGTVLAEVDAFAPKYAKKDWEERMQSTPTVLSSAQPGLAPRTLGPDSQSLRAFQTQNRTFYRTPEAVLIDDATGSHWNFQGCATSGPAKGTCLQPLEITQDYWFDWRHYNPATTVFTSP